MTTFSVNLAGKTAKPYGVGMRVVAGGAILKPTAEAIHAGDIDLKSIHAIQLSDVGTYGAGTVAAAFPVIDTPGSYDNYASVVIVTLHGSAHAAPTGTFTLQFMAIGE